MSVIHFSEQYKKTLLEGFNKASETDALFSHDMDMEFSGVKTVHVTSLKTEKLQDYDRSATVGDRSRYGTTKEVGDEVQTFTMTQDKALSLSIDKGNNAEQFNMKKAGAVMKAHRDEQIIPEVDTYRLAKWAENGGIHKALSAKPSKTTIVTDIIELHNEMLDAGVPEQITLVIARSYLPALKLSTEWAALDSLGGKTLPKGTIGEFDGMPVKPMTTKKMPANVPFMLIYKGAVISPMKINDFKGHVDPPGLSGDLLEFRMMYDAFVLGKKANGVAVACLPGTVSTEPAIEVNGNEVEIGATGTSEVRYTVDGTDPRYSADAKTAVGLTSLNLNSYPDCTVIRACAVDEGKYMSNVVDKVVR